MSDALATVTTSNAPKPIGNYSQAVVCNNLVFISGQLPIDPITNDFVSGDIEERTQQCLKNIKSIAEAAGTFIDKTVKINIYLADIETVKKVNNAYDKYFSEIAPARLLIQVAKLPKNADVEIEAIVSM